VEGEALQVVPQAAPTKLGLKTLIAKNVVGWAREPGTNLAVLVTAGKGCLVHDDNGKRITDPSFQFHNKFPAPVGKADFRAHAETLGSGEGVIPWLYQDGKYNVTVGIGRLIRDAAEARRIGAQCFFFNRGIHGRIDAQAVVDAFHAVKNAKGATPGKASTYEDISEVRMESQAMVDLFDDDVDTKLKEIRAIKQFRYYSSYPPAGGKAWRPRLGVQRGRAQHHSWPEHQGISKVSGRGSTPRLGDSCGRVGPRRPKASAQCPSSHLVPAGRQTGAVFPAGANQETVFGNAEGSSQVSQVTEIQGIHSAPTRGLADLRH